MTSVKPGFPEDELHLQMLVGLLFNRIHRGLGGEADEGWGGLRRSHLRVLQGVPAPGTSVTDLAERIGMTKQGCGQLVTQLVEIGQLAVAPDPADGRVRLVRRTRRGQRTMARFLAAVTDVEQQLADEVGPARYAEFRRVLEQLVLDPA